MIGGGYLAAGVAAAILAASTASFFVGMDYGADSERAEQAEALEAALKDKSAAEKRIGELELAAQTRETERETVVREIYRDVPRIVTRDVYRNVCIDADGLGLLDRAADAANGRIDTGSAPSSPARASQGPSEGRRDR